MLSDLNEGMNKKNGNRSEETKKYSVSQTAITSTSSKLSTINEQDRAVKSYTLPKQQETIQLLKLENAVESITAVPKKVDPYSFLCGFTAGILQAGIFSPIDKALFLSIKNQSAFLSWNNFHNPFQGFFQSIGGRALSAGLYFPLEQLFRSRLPSIVDHWNSSNKPSLKRTRSDAYEPIRRRPTTKRTMNDENHAFENFLAGTTAGALNAMILNPLSAIKYKTWGRSRNRGMIYEIYSMLRKSNGSIVPFINGTRSTLLRDVTFGGAYTLLRLQIPKILRLPEDNEQQWIANLIAASLATVLSGPFNYARNLQYATKSSDAPQTTLQLLRAVAIEANQRKTYSKRLHYIAFKFRIGWGTARVATGITFGHYIYDKLHEIFRPD